MVSQTVSLFLILCIYGATALTYKEAFTQCKDTFAYDENKNKINVDNEIDYFFQHGSFQTKYDNIKCVFNCLATSLNVVDAVGNVQVEPLRQLAKANPTEVELQTLAAEKALTSCVQGRSETAQCERVYGYVQCALAVASTATA